MTRNQLFELHASMCAQASHLMRSKNDDYADGADALGNLRMCEELSHGHVTTELGILIRMTDKLSRLYNFHKNGRFSVENEGLRDTCLDLINYAVLLEAAFSRSAPSAPAGSAPPPQETACDGPRYRLLERDRQNNLYDVVDSHNNDATVIPWVTEDQGRNHCMRLNSGHLVPEDLKCEP